MKKILPLLLVLCSIMASAQTKYSLWYQDIITWQLQLNHEFADSAQSPLTIEDRLEFKSLNFYRPDTTFRVMATWELTPETPVFQMKTSGTKTPLYRAYGKLYFTIHTVSCTLTVYQNIALTQKPEYEHHLFVPFTDQTNGTETYAGGRYLDLMLPEFQPQMLLDFNKAYHPYCAYNKKYSCPIPPPENLLLIEIRAGVRL